MKTSDVIIIAGIMGASVVGILYFTKSWPFDVKQPPKTEVKTSSGKSDYEDRLDKDIDKETYKKFGMDILERGQEALDRYNKKTAPEVGESPLEWFGGSITKGAGAIGGGISEAGESTLEWFGGIGKGIQDAVGSLGCMITKALGGTCSGAAPIIALPTRDIMGTRQSADYLLAKIREAQRVSSEQAKTKTKPASKAECDLLKKYGLEPISGGYC